jgi:hypothetical protein
MRYHAICLCCLGGVLFAQQAVTSTPEAAESSKSDTVGDYAVTQSFETGYRSL